MKQLKQRRWKMLRITDTVAETTYKALGAVPAIFHTPHSETKLHTTLDPEDMACEHEEGPVLRHQSPQSMESS